VTDRARWAEVVAQTVAHFGALHVLINNAGVSVFGNADEASHADYDWIMGVNFGGVANGLVAALPAIKAAGGKRGVVNVASMAAFLPGPQAGLYTASKFAVRGLTESLRYNLAPHGIACAVLPRAYPHQCLGQRAQAARSLCRKRLWPVDETALRQFGTAFEAGMDPDEVGRKIVAGLVRGDGLILTHPNLPTTSGKSTKRAWPPCRRKRRHRRGWKSSACAAPPWPRPGPASPWAWPT
jgi:NAD(P)-dependent dehydrogenase (short-subunit alcohol dehydrogenase family)